MPVGETMIVAADRVRAIAGLHHHLPFMDIHADCRIQAGREAASALASLRLCIDSEATIICRLFNSL